MDRRTFYFKQPVTEDELNGAFDAVEHALDNLIADQLLDGIVSNLNGAQVSPTPNLTVTVSGPGSAYDELGQRIFQPNATDTVNCAQDSNSVSTAVTTGGNERWVSVFIKFKRAASDPRVDGNSNVVDFVENESYQYVVTQGAEAAIGTATRPTLDPTMVLLFDVNLVHSQTQILNANISTTRRQDMFVMAGSPLSLRAGTPFGAVQAMLTELNNHILGLAGAHPASGITTILESGTRFSLTASDVQTNLAAIQSQIDSRMTNGTDTVLTFATATALRAATPHIANGMVGVTGLGAFLWDSASTATDDGLFVIKETATATGRWRSIAAVLDVANGLPTLDGSARLLAKKVRNGIIDTGEHTVTSTDVGGIAGTDQAGGGVLSNPSSATYLDVEDQSAQPIAVTFTSEVNAGDVILVDCHWRAATDNATHPAIFELAVVDNGTTVELFETETRCRFVDAVGVGPQTQMQVAGRYVVTHSTTNSTCVVKFRARNDGTGITQIGAPIALRAILIRP